jgi:hypothetical protein
MTGSRHTTAAVINPASRAPLPIQAAASGIAPLWWPWRLGGPASGAIGSTGRGSSTGGISGSGGSAAAVSRIGSGTGGCGSATGRNSGTGVGESAHCVVHRTQRTTRPAAKASGTSYSAAQVGQVICTGRLCLPAEFLATADAFDFGLDPAMSHKDTNQQSADSRER